MPKIDAAGRKAYLQRIEDTIARGEYQDNWESLSQVKLPEWYPGTKFGIFIHWGIYCVPAFNNEWYPRNMYIQGRPEFEHHIKTYGPHNKFGYKDYIPMFKAEHFSPKEWIALFQETGATYVMPVGEHHEGFQMYASDISEWNAAEMGPCRNVLGELKTAAEEAGMIFCTSSHRAEHWFFLGHGKEFDSDIKEPLTLGDFYWPSMPEPDNQDLYSPAPTQEFLEDWLIRTCEIVHKYQPRILYFDWWIQHSAFKPYLKKFAAYYYNRAQAWGGAVINYKHDAFMFGAAVVDMERGKFADIKPFVWQTDTSIARNSWCYTEQNIYKSAREIVCELVDVVSKNGRLLLNIDPKADGSIPEQTTAILKEIGAWMKVNGEAIHGSHIWRTAAEGPTKTQEGQFADGAETAYTPEDIRFTVKGTNLYATVLRFPEDGVVRICSLAEKDASHLPVFHGIIRDVAVLGYEDKPEFKRTEEALVIHTKGIKSELPVVFKIALD